jgi:hypothetical protein
MVVDPILRVLRMSGMHAIGRLRSAVSATAAAVALSAACSSSHDEAIGADHSADTSMQGYCRARNCPPPSNYPTDTACEPADWADSAACKGYESDAPLWWRTACVGYDLNEKASRYASYDVALQAVRAAFDAWTKASCPASAGARPSIDVRDLGPVPCAHTAYDKTGGPNQNVIVFHDDMWPHEGGSKSLTIALTTVTSDRDTGEIYDADIELNTADWAIAQLPAGAPGDGTAFDLQSVLTHEIGHFFGLAHSPLSDAVMNPSGDGDLSATRRVLAAEDVRGICAIYPPDGTRWVSTLVDPSGSIAEGACDPTPHHGFTPDCP